MPFLVSCRGHVAFLTVIWFLYPIVFLIGPEGLRIIDDPASVWAILIMDVVAKVVYAFYAANNVDKALRERGSDHGYEHGHEHGRVHA